MGKIIRFLITHAIAVAFGVALGIYLLPILTEPEGPSEAEVAASSQQAIFSGRFSKELEGSDFFHWGEGEVSISATRVSFSGAMAPGPDYQLYLTPELVQTEAAFNAVKADSVRLGAVRTFDSFIVGIPANVNPADYRALVVWCESFGEFITAASYR